MTTDSNNGDMVEISVKIPEGLLGEIDKLVEELEYTNRSKLIRAVLDDTTEPLLTPGAQKGISAGYTDVAAGRTMSTDEARDRLGIEKSAN